ncbi:uncharacterized protein LOC141690685 [Apium graveolens]|uniref:uncharacterized protein LOC141690685 n=1 Tax=Apium graveolens TaxID=4045 RepID=UPI003D7A1CDF
MAHERVRKNTVDEFKLVLISSSSASGRPNHIAPSNEVAGLIVTSSYAKGCRDTVIDSRVDGLQRISETDPRFILVKHSKIDVEFTESEDPDEKGAREYITMREFYNYKLIIRLSEGLAPHLGGRLWQQYVVDAFTAIEQYRLDWIRDHQITIRSDLYHNIRDAMQKGDKNPSNIGKSIILTASFTGSKRYMTQYFKDSLEICRTLGHPSLFLTMTTNTKWPEIQRMLKHMPGVGVAKRGLPHAHILIWFHPDDRPKTTEQIDKMVLAEIPDPEIDPVGYNAGHDTTTMCLRKIRTGTSVTIPKKAPKGPIDEVKHYLDGRYVCASEVSWRIFAFDIHSRWPLVERLPIYLPGEKHVSFKAGDVLEDVCDKAI